MGLTSNFVLWLAVVLAVVLFAATVWLWPRLARRHWRAVTGRIALLLAAQLTLFSATGLAANQSFGFYASWADLFGQEKGQGVVVDHDTAVSRLKVSSTRELKVSGGSSRPEVAGRLEKVEVTGHKSRIASSAYVYLPPEYFQSAHRERRFPAVTVLTGYPGTTEALINGLKYPQTAHEQVREKRMRPMILVMLRPTLAPPRDTECVDVPRGPQTETFLAKDLPEAVAGHYRVTGKRGWGVIGSSTGGYCALKLAAHHPEVYRAGAGLSPHYKAPIDSTTGDLFQGDKALEQRADLFWFLRHTPPPRTSLLVSSSKHGEDNYQDTKKFIDLVKSRPPTRISSVILTKGGHNFNTWRREIPAAMVWLSERIEVEGRR
ncbi:esterase [Streptomyces sp. NA04227]|uniref:alpha/beta hydrolase n=1 Tax=Streptomyces sp. NA04227 TaxID=2742136 RepID=UPI0015900317|nr:alpha/beta hydrolase-fold protein [Streptomyces sp. NA04227]QKW07271.1 esterase [Streptomyces sp. NA04227]